LNWESAAFAMLRLGVRSPSAPHLTQHAWNPGKQQKPAVFQGFVRFDLASCASFSVILSPVLALLGLGFSDGFPSVQVAAIPLGWVVVRVGMGRDGTAAARS